MQFSLSAMTAILAIGASAAPSEDLSNRVATVSGHNDGSIYRYGNAAVCRNILYRNGACGLSTYFAGKIDPKTPLVAMPATVFDNYGSTQHNTLCGKILTMKHGGVTRKVAIADRNLSGEHSIDMCLDTWQAFRGHDNEGSVIKSIDWTV